MMFSFFLFLSFSGQVIVSCRCSFLARGRKRFDPRTSADLSFRSLARLTTDLRTVGVAVNAVRRQATFKAELKTGSFCLRVVRQPEHRQRNARQPDLEVGSVICSE